MNGYKVFNPDWTCNGFQYEVGKTYIHDGNVRLCNSGFHFCQKASNCFNYYSFMSENHVAEIEADGVIEHGDDKSVCGKITIIREIPWNEVLTIVNEGKDNSGLCNTGNSNTGNRNTGNSNTGNMNTGNSNTGNMNTGNRNTGDWNTGNMNTGNWNTGNRNTGNSNTGDLNTGNWNTGDWNTGNMNTGNRNTGDWNTGNMNTGNWNTGDWNTTKYSSGIFCTEIPNVLIFDSPSEITLEDWRNSEARYLLDNIQTIIWVPTSSMTISEKELHPEYETTGGFLKTVHLVEATEKWWSELDEIERGVIKSIPNFDSEKFYKITGLRV